MTNLEALVSMAQTLLRVRGEWCVEGIDETLRRDIRAAVFDISKMMRFDGDADAVVADAIDELERRATPFEYDEGRMFPFATSRHTTTG